MSNLISAELPDLNNHGEKKKWNSMKILFIVVSVLAFYMLVSGLAAMIFPDLGIPVWWIAFQIGPMPVPIPQ